MCSHKEKRKSQKLKSLQNCIRNAQLMQEHDKHTRHVATDRPLLNSHVQFNVNLLSWERRSAWGHKSAEGPLTGVSDEVRLAEKGLRKYIQTQLEQRGRTTPRWREEVTQTQRCPFSQDLVRQLPIQHLSYSSHTSS